MYVRCICHVSEWNVDNFENIPNIALSDWFTSSDSDYSMFKVNSFQDTQMLDRIAFYFFSQNPRKHCKFSFLPITDEFAHQLPEIQDDGSTKIGTLHANVKNATYKDFKICIEYTYEHRRDFIAYDFQKFRKVFQNITEENMAQLLVELNLERKDQRKLLSQIQLIYFRGESYKYQKLLDSYR